MYLPPEIIDLVFDFIDVKPVIYAIDEIHQHNEEIYNLEYFSTGSIGRATYSLFLKRRNLIKEYTDSIPIMCFVKRVFIIGLNQKPTVWKSVLLKKTKNC